MERSSRVSNGRLNTRLFLYLTRSIGIGPRAHRLSMPPNRVTVETLAKCDQTDDLHPATDAEDLFGQLGI